MASSYFARFNQFILRRLDPRCDDERLTLRVYRIVFRPNGWHGSSIHRVRLDECVEFVEIYINRVDKTRPRLEPDREDRDTSRFLRCLCEFLPFCIRRAHVGDVPTE